MSQERELLRETVAALVDKHASAAAVRDAMASERGYDESLWKLLCEQVGAAALVVPEELGGAGGELADAAVALEELGKALVPTPLLGTTLAELALLAADEHDSETIERLAEGTSIGTVVFDPGYVVNANPLDYLHLAPCRHDGPHASSRATRAHGHDGDRRRSRSR
jgi:alkylation response protein AidB-like acyl-CoA dehydrogenase